MLVDRSAATGCKSGGIGETMVELYHNRMKIVNVRMEDWRFQKPKRWDTVGIRWVVIGRVGSESVALALGRSSQPVHRDGTAILPLSDRAQFPALLFFHPLHLVVVLNSRLLRTQTMWRLREGNCSRVAAQKGRVMREDGYRERGRVARDSK
ncbi:hypothetical protein N657DRAFT_98387 [Parathielavia appendiculata]|uniref:Uncharacterized protein n=1 Tax=Parathielavia appendiculata TaxID=2587402 RepID=A0AAN6Z189_9PEZI|nr:hypothetical protein N657DRAFT_98387 [Parathielavia appendiculata]